MRLTFEGATWVDLVTQVRTFVEREKIAPTPEPAQGAVFSDEPPFPAQAEPVRSASQANPYACKVHLTEMVYHGPGVNKAGKPYSASYRCPVAGCRGQTVWADMATGAFA